MINNLGQLIITGIQGLTLSSEEASFLKEGNIGGVILFAHNYEDPAQLAELVNSIQKLRGEYPFFISVDQEGGRVIRFKKHFTQFPSMLSLSRLGSPKLIFETHQVMAKELAACGINLSFSPCCDILTNPDNKVIGDRAFGTNAQDVEKFVTAAIRGLQTNGVMACAKHFPGHGGTTKDSHYDLPLVKTSLEELRNKEFLPFIKASRSKVEFIMMAHLMVDSIDDQLPTTLSSKAYDYLRNEVGFSKIIITDDMEMKAIADRFTIEESTIKALAAGADVVLFRFLDDARKALNAIEGAVENKQLSKESVLQKLNRIQSAKKLYLANYQTIYIPKISEFFNSKESQEILEQFNTYQQQTPS